MNWIPSDAGWRLVNDRVERMTKLVKSNKGVSSEICSLFSWEASAGSRTSLGLVDGADLCQHQQHPRRGSAATAHRCCVIVDCCCGMKGLGVV